MIRKLVWFLLLTSLFPSLLSAQVLTYTKKAPDFTNDVKWLDQGAKEPHSLKGYRGQVVLIDFWDYTCINCIRDFAVVKSWYAKYHPYGFQVIGVHYGEFKIGQDLGNIEHAAQRFQLPWPVVADVEGAMWREYRSDVWPNRYLIDQDGNIVMQVEGEGHNREMEARLRELLARQHPQVAKIALDAPEQAFSPACGITTNEMYVGDWYGRGSLAQHYHDHETASFKADRAPADGTIVLGGRWYTQPDGMRSEATGDTAAVRYHARSAYAVISVADPKKPVRVNIEQDGAPLKKADAGADVRFDTQGAYIEVSAPRMYDLVKNAGNGLPLPEHVLTLKPQGKGLTIESFTFGNNCQQNFAQR
jgi:glutathione peroxidase-family protein